MLNLKTTKTIDCYEFRGAGTPHWEKGKFTVLVDSLSFNIHHAVYVLCEAVSLVSVPYTLSHSPTNAMLWEIMLQPPAQTVKP
jgi:hypothetical protein